MTAVLHEQIGKTAVKAIDNNNIAKTELNRANLLTSKKVNSERNVTKPYQSTKKDQNKYWADISLQYLEVECKFVINSINYPIK